jgi:predicted nucleic acid-binding Zn ribbon protein
MKTVSEAGDQRFVVDRYFGRCWRWVDGRPMKLCPICSQPVYPWPDTKVYCSSRCRKTAAARRHRQTHSEEKPRK